MAKLGSLEVSPLGIGTWAWGDRIVWGYHGHTDDAGFQAAFESTLTHGIDLFDTAEFYGFGRSEKLIGQFLKTAKSDKPIYIATKFMPLPWRFGKRSLINALRASLRRLELPHVDLYQIHWPSPVPLEIWMNG